jgi:hypothetical protein
MSIAAREPLTRSGPPPFRDDDRASGRAAATERRAGRRAISVSLLLIGVFVLVSGVWSLLLSRGSLAVPVHATAGFLFVLLSAIHVRYNRNAVRLYLRDLGWSPAVMRLLVAAAISLVLLAPVLRLV